MSGSFSALFCRLTCSMKKHLVTMLFLLLAIALHQVTRILGLRQFDQLTQKSINCRAGLRFIQ